MSWVYWEKASAGLSGRGELWKWRRGSGGRKAGWRKRWKRIRLTEIDRCPRRRRRLKLGVGGGDIRAVLSFASGQLCSTRTALPEYLFRPAQWRKGQSRSGIDSLLRAKRNSGNFRDRRLVPTRAPKGHTTIRAVILRSTAPQRMHEHGSARKNRRQSDGRFEGAQSGCAVEIDLEERKDMIVTFRLLWLFKDNACEIWWFVCALLWLKGHVIIRGPFVPVWNTLHSPLSAECSTRS